MATELKLPSWATVGEDKETAAIVIEVDSEAAYKEWLGLLKCTTPDQYFVECAYQCAKMDVQKALEGTEFDPRNAGKSHEIHFSRAPQFALASLPAGKGVDAATKGRGARDHYRRLRGAIPFS